MADVDVTILLGQFMASRRPDTAADPFNPSKAFIDVVDPMPGLVLSSPAPLPPEPIPVLSSPAPLPPEPVPVLSSPAPLPPEPVPVLSSPAVLPPQPAPALSAPAVLPPEPVPVLTSPAVLPPQPVPALTNPAILPPIPEVKITPTVPAPIIVPPAYPKGTGPEAQVPFAPGNQQNVRPPDPLTLADQAVKAFFQIIDQVASLSPLDAVLSADVASISATVQSLAGQLVLNRYSPDVPYTKHAFMSAGDLVDDILTGKDRFRVIHDDPVDSTGLKRVGFAIGGTVGPALLGGVPAPVGIVNIFTGQPVQLASPAQWDPIPGQALSLGRPIGNRKLESSAFPGGIIPARFKQDNKQGFMIFSRGSGPKIDDDEAYVPLSLTDLRPVGQIYRTVYYRPLNVKLAESFSPSWNKTQYLGRVDPVATYQATGRTISLSFLMAAFGPEDVQVIWNKLFWLTSMVYPEYDSDLQYLSGPVVRLRVGDVINALGPEGGRGLPGVIDSLEFDYGDSIWELRKNLKVPRNIEVSLSFQVLHDMPIGRGDEGKFGGIGTFDANGLYQPPSRNNGDVTALGSGDDTIQFPKVHDGAAAFRTVGEEGGDPNGYETLGGSDGLGVQIPSKH